MSSSNFLIKAALAQAANLEARSRAAQEKTAAFTSKLTLYRVKNTSRGFWVIAPNAEAALDYAWRHKTARKRESLSVEDATAQIKADIEHFDLQGQPLDLSALDGDVMGFACRSIPRNPKQPQRWIITLPESLPEPLPE